MIANAYLRMAETRSVSRALRLYLGIGMTAYDELPGKEQETPAIPPLAPEPVVEPEPLTEWTAKERAAFHARRKEPDIGFEKDVDYEVIKQVCKNLDRPMPKHMTTKQRTELLLWLASGKAEKHIEDAETIIDYNTHAKGE